MLNKGSRQSTGEAIKPISGHSSGTTIKVKNLCATKNLPELISNQITMEDPENTTTEDMNKSSSYHESDILISCLAAQGHFKILTTGSSFSQKIAHFLSQSFLAVFCWFGFCWQSDADCKQGRCHIKKFPVSHQ
jgi:hypothetical protein